MVTSHFHFNGFFPNMLYFFSFISFFLRRLYLVTPTFIIEPIIQTKIRPLSRTDFRLAPPVGLEPTPLLLRCPKVAVGLERLQLLTAAPTHIRFICHRQRSYALQITAARSWSLRRFGGYKILLSLKLN